MKKCLKVILCITGTIALIILIFWLCLHYEMNYKKTICDTAISPDEKYQITLMAIGEPDWPFGLASGRLILKEGKNRISQTDFELWNDGGNVSNGCWKVTWYEDYVEVILSGEEQSDEQVILYFNGGTDIQQLSEKEVVQSTESRTVDSNDKTMYFLSDNNIGWRLVVTDAAAGSRFYVMEKTVDGGSVWECINDDPFSGQAGVAEGLIFYDENFGVAGITGASGSSSKLYITQNGGLSFEEIELPMNVVTELPETAKDYGFAVEDYDYLNMPEKDAVALTITVTTDAIEYEGIVFRSLDKGVSWEYQGVTSAKN